MSMTLERALRFLRDNQPLPSDEHLKPSVLDELDAVRRFLERHPDEKALRLLLGVFGDGSGFGAYQRIEDAVAVHDKDVVVAALACKLQHGPRSVRYWCAQIATAYPDDRLVEPLALGLTSDDDDLRYAVVTALEAIGSDTAVAKLREWLPHEPDDELRTVIESAI